MRALQSIEKGPPSSLVLAEVADPEVSGSQVLIEMHAAGVNFPDLLVIEDQYQLRPPRPFTPGGELAGVVLAVGNEVTRFKKGDRVLGYASVGAFAEKTAVLEDRCYPMPASMPFAVGAGLIFTYCTSYHALVHRAALQKGERLLVLGAAGGVGVAAMQLGLALGAEVIAAVRGDAKVDFCRKQGATTVIDYAREDLKQRLKELGGVDVVYDAVGGDYSEAALRALRPGGRLLVIGFAAGAIPRIPLNLPLLKECSIVGVQWGAWAHREPEQQRAMVEALVTMWEQKKIAPHVHGEYPLAEAVRALDDLAARRVQGKAVIVP